VLQVLAKRLVATVRDDDLVARFGGDEFAVVFSDGTASGDVVNTEQRILDSIEAPIKVRDDLALSVTASIGYATDEPTAVLRAADAALYRAKQARCRPQVVKRESERLRALGDPTAGGGVGGR
jgi:diguanylate cyclase (GGDEF)-like protein